jgi:hypothetical protein
MWRLRRKTERGWYDGFHIHTGEEARGLCETLNKLERERDEAREELSEWRILNGWGGTPEIIHDFIKGQQTRIHHAQDLEEELATVTAQRDRLADLVKQFIAILDITEESDSGRLFHPTNITSCRAGDLQKIGELVEALRRASKTTNPNA